MPMPGNRSEQDLLMSMAGNAYSGFALVPALMALLTVASVPLERVAVGTRQLLQNLLLQRRRYCVKVMALSGFQSLNRRTLRRLVCCNTPMAICCMYGSFLVQANFLKLSSSRLICLSVGLPEGALLFGLCWERRGRRSFTSLAQVPESTRTLAQQCLALQTAVATRL